MPRRTNIHSWPAPRPDYFAGQRGGRPVPTPAPWPKPGDKLPHERGTYYGKSFRSHDEAVAYAKLFDEHIDIKVIYREDIDGNMLKLFVVSPRKRKDDATR